MVKCKKFLSKNNRLEAQQSIIFIAVALFFTLILIENISSQTITTAKTYDAFEKKITITNAFAVGEKIAEYKLLENSDVCNGNQCYAKGTIVLYEDSRLLDRLNIYNPTKSILVNLQSYKIYLITTKSESYDYTYGENCTGDKCSFSEKRTGTRTIEIKTEYKDEILKAGTYTWRIEGVLGRYKSVDWVIDTLGVELKEWSSWVYGPTVIDLHNMPYPNTNSQGAGPYGIRITPIANVTLDAFGFDTRTADIIECGVTDSGVNQLRNGTVSGKNCIISYNLTKGVAYYIWVNNQAGSFTHYYSNENTSNITMTNLIVTGALQSNGGLSWDPLQQIAPAAYRISNIVNMTTRTYEYFTTALIVVQNSPLAGFSTTANNITFNCSATENTEGILNMTFQIDGVDNYTMFNTTSKQNLSIQIARNVAEGNHSWACRASSKGEDTIEGPRLFYVDSIAPRINILYPSNGTSVNTLVIGYNMSMNLSLIHSGVTDSCRFYNSTANISVACGLNVTAKVNDGYRTFSYWSNDSSANEGSNSTTFFINYIIPYVNFTARNPEGENTTIWFNVTANIITSVNATLSYNGTQYLMTLFNNNGSLAQFYRTVTSPLVGADAGMTINVTYNINGQQFNTTKYTQTVDDLSPLVVNTSCANASLYFYLVNEQTKQNVTGDFYYNFFYGLSNNNTLLGTYGSITNKSGFYVCIDPTNSPNYYIGYGEIQYTNESMTSRRYYVFANTRISTPVIEIPIYDLLDTEDTSFLFTVQTTSLIAYQNYYIGLLRWYPDLNAYRVVEIEKTDEKGQAVLKVKTENVDYRIGIYEPDGTLVKLLEPIKFICQTNPCTYTITIDPEPLDLTSYTNIQSSLTFNTATKIFTFIWNDPSQASQSMNLTVYKDTSISSEIICTSTSSGYTGVLNCDVSAFTGKLRAEVYRTASPSVVFAQLIKNIGSTFISAGGGAIGLFIGAMLLIFFALIGVMSPIMVVIMGCLALVPLFIMGNIQYIVLIGIGVLGGIIINFLRRTTS